MRNSKLLFVGLVGIVLFLPAYILGWKYSWIILFISYLLFCYTLYPQYKRMTSYMKNSLTLLFFITLINILKLIDNSVWKEILTLGTFILCLISSVYSLIVLRKLERGDNNVENDSSNRQK